jgi:hypothetical protein
MALDYSAIETKKNKIHSRHAQPKSDINAQRKISLKQLKSYMKLLKVD